MLSLIAAFALARSQPGHVLVVVNRSSADSVAVGEHYSFKRHVPKDNILEISVKAEEEVTSDEFQSNVLDPVRRAVKDAKNRIDYIVLTKGVPIRVREKGFSVDSLLAAMDLQDTNAQRPNPYFLKSESFSSEKFGMYLVTRLDGYTAGDAKALVERSLAAKPARGPFLFDEADNRRTGSYNEIQKRLAASQRLLAAKGLQARLDTQKEFVSPAEPLAGYVSWGSNDGAFDLAKYRSIKFLPGAVCETFVSTSARTFLPTEGGQSLIADLIKGGVTGVKGYVSEPYTFALAKPDVLFDRYTDGRNLAESFYAASPVIHWKDVVIGDPLCAPYAKR